MAMWLVVATAVTLVVVVVTRMIASARGRDPFRWGLAAALFPPIILLLLALPTSASVPRERAS